MKALLFLVIFTSLGLVSPAIGQLSDTTGLKQVFNIQTGGYDFEVEVVSNFNVINTEFSSDEKKLTLYISSNVENNLAEIQIPINLINGEFTFFLNEQEIFPNVQLSDKISFIVVEFEGDGNHKLEIIGTTYLPEFSEIAPLVLAASIVGILLVNKMKKPHNYSFNKA